MKLVTKRPAVQLIAQFKKGDRVQFQRHKDAPVVRGTFIQLDPRTPAFSQVREDGFGDRIALVSTSTLRKA